MILYYGITTYHFLCFILHKKIYHNNEDAILFIPERINDAYILKENFKKYNIFKEIYLFKEIFFHYKDLSSEILETCVNKYIKQAESYPYNFFDFSEINIAQDYHSLGIYLNINKIKYNYFEEGLGRLSSDEQLCEHIKKINKVGYELIKKYKLLGHTDNVVTRYGDLKHQSLEYFNKKDKHFSVNEILSKLSINEINEIASVFIGKQKCFKINNSKNDTILLTQHYINLGILSYKEQEELYKYVLDYFSIGNIYIKVHPSDIHSIYKDWFPGSIIIPRLLPAELLPYFIANKFKKCISISSTSVNSLSNIYNELVIFDQLMEKTFYRLNKYFTIINLIHHIISNSNIKYKLFMFGGNNTLINALKDNFFNDIENIKNFDLNKDFNVDNKILIIDSLENDQIKYTNLIIKNHRPNDIFIFVNSNKRGYFIDLKLNNLKFLIPIKIETSNTNEFIFIYSKNKHILEIGLLFKMYKILKYSGITISVDMTDNTEVKILEGINRALEERLFAITIHNKNLFYENSELKSKLQKYENNKINYLSKINYIILKFIFENSLKYINKKKYNKYLNKNEDFFDDSKYKLIKTIGKIINNKNNVKNI